ncbi:MAG: SHD1 domain-containing protein [Pirellulaceae bacterium]
MIDPRTMFCPCCVWAAAFVTVLFAVPAAGQTNRSFKPDDEIEVFYQNKWWPARALDMNKRGDVLAEFEFASQPRRQAFRNGDVRYAFESGALVRARTWSNESGEFSVRAALLRIDDTTVSLRKADKQEIKVPIDKLSQTDQAFLKRLEKDLGTAMTRQPELPPVQEFDRSALTSREKSATESSRRALAADPVPGYLQLQAGGVAFPIPSVWDRLGAIIPLGGADSWLLAAVESRETSSPVATRMLWASMKKGELGGQQSLPPGEVVLDYHPPSHRLLTWATVSQEDAEQKVLTVWEVLPTDKQVKLVVRWNVTPPERPVREPWGRLVDGQVAVFRWTNQEYTGWDIVGQRLIYRLTQESFFAPLPTLSGGRRYLFLPEDKGVRVIEAATGELASFLPSTEGTSGVAITEDGQRAAVLGRSSLTIWPLTDAQAEPERIQAEAISYNVRGKLHWVNDRQLMVDGIGGSVLFSLDHKLALWSYRFDSDAVHESEGRRLRDLVNGHLVYAASVRSGTQRGLAVGAVKLPGPKVNEATASLNPDSLMIVKAGSQVRVDVRAGGDAARIRAALEQKIANNDWQLSPSARTVLIAEMKQGETQQVTYRTFGFGSGASEETVTVQPHISELRVEVDGKVAWMSRTSSGVPPILHLKEGESMQGEVNKWQKPNPDFFDQVRIPDRILDPAKRNGLGRTQVTNRGLVPDDNTTAKR